MTENTRRISRGYTEGLFSAISAGFFLTLIGIFFVIVPNLFDKITAFFQGFDLVHVPHMNGVLFPAPQNLAEHSTIYSTAEQFSIVWSIFLIALLAARFLAHSPKRKKADNLGDIVFWLGAAYFIQTMLIDSAQLDFAGWFGFWTTIIMLVGVSLIARAIYLAAVRKSPA